MIRYKWARSVFTLFLNLCRQRFDCLSSSSFSFFFLGIDPFIIKLETKGVSDAQCGSGGCLAVPHSCPGE